ncbi:MAG: hypothetical protein ABWY93_18645 [Mycobacterium sp.]
MFTRHAAPATLTSMGRVCATYTPGNADTLRGPARFNEVYLRLRQRYNRRAAARLTLTAYRTGIALSGDRSTPAGRARGRQALRRIADRRRRPVT